MGRLNCIVRFMSRLTDRCHLFFKLLKKNTQVRWDEECEAVFNKIKNYLMNLPVLIVPLPGRALFLYLTVLPESIGCVLGQKDQEGRERVMYCLSKHFREGEQKYSEIEKTCCILVWLTHRLRQYTLYYTIELIMKHEPLRYLVNKPTLVRWISKW